LKNQEHLYHAAEIVVFFSGSFSSLIDIFTLVVVDEAAEKKQKKENIEKMGFLM
jgi:hypothetical protein